MARDVDIEVGADTSAAGAGLAALRNYGQQAHSELTSIFSRAIAVGGIVEAFNQVIEKAHELHHESERFGIDAEQLQLVANAAKEHGLSLDTVARALNKMLIGGEAALQNQTALRVDMEKFHAGNPAEKFLLIADAVKEAGINTESYDAVAKIFGSRFGTELIPLLIQGKTSIEEVSRAMGIMSNATSEHLDRAHKAFQTFGNVVQIVVGNLLDFSLKILESEWDILKGSAIELKDVTVGAFHAIERAIHLDWAGAENEWKKALAQMKADAIAAKNDIGGVWKSAGKPPGKSVAEWEPDTLGNASTSGMSGDGAGGGGRSSGQTLATLERKNYLDQLNGEEKIVTILQEKWDLQDQLNRGIKDGVSTLEEEDDLRVQILEKDTEIKSVQKEINDAAKKTAETQTRIREAVDKEADAIERKNRFQQLILEYGQDVGTGMERELEISEQIEQVAQRISDAYRDGDDLTGDELTKLKEQLQTEKEQTVEINKQNKAREIGRKAAVDFNSERSGISSEQQEQLRKQGKDPREIAALGGLGTGIATLGQNVSYTDYDVLRATRFDGTIDQDKLDRLRVQNRINDIRRLLSGSQQNPQANIGFAEAAQLNAKTIAIGKAQSAAALKEQTDALLAELREIVRLLYPPVGAH